MSFSFIKACYSTTDFNINLHTLARPLAQKLSSCPQSTRQSSSHAMEMYDGDVMYGLKGFFNLSEKPSENRWIFNENNTSKRNKIQFSDNL